jgi:hypothetical protein
MGAHVVVVIGRAGRTGLNGRSAVVPGKAAPRAGLLEAGEGLGQTGAVQCSAVQSAIIPPSLFTKPGHLSQTHKYDFQNSQILLRARCELFS